MFVGSSGTHLRVVDPVAFEVTDDFVVPAISTGGVLRFSDDGSVLVAKGVNQDPETFEQSGAVARIDPATGEVLWTIGPDEYGNGQCDTVAFSVPEDRMWCGDYFGTIRGRSLSTGALDGTTIAHQRGWLSSLDLATIDGGRYLVSMGWNSALVGRWQIDGLGPVQRRIADSYDWIRYSPGGEWALVAGPDDSSPQGFKSAIWDPVADRSVLALDGDFVDSGWVGRDRIAEVADDGSVSIVGVPNGTAEQIDVTVETDWANLTFLPSGFVAAGYADGRVVLHGIDDGSSVTMQLTNPSGTFQPMANSVVLSPDLTTVYVGAQGAVGLRSQTGRQVANNDDTQIGLVATRPTGRSRRRCSTARSNCSITTFESSRRCRAHVGWCRIYDSRATVSCSPASGTTTPCRCTTWRHTSASVTRSPLSTDPRSTSTQRGQNWQSPDHTGSSLEPRSRRVARRRVPSRRPQPHSGRAPNLPRRSRQQRRHVSGAGLKPVAEAHRDVVHAVDAL